MKPSSRQTPSFGCGCFVVPDVVVELLVDEEDDCVVVGDCVVELDEPGDSPFDFCAHPLLLSA